MTTSSPTRPGCVIVLIEESAAMAARPAGSVSAAAAPPSAQPPLAAQAATAVNALLNQLSAGPDFSVAVVGYSDDGTGQVSVGGRLGGVGAGRGLVPLKELLAAPARVETRHRKVPGTGPLDPPREEPVSFPVWYEPAAGAKGPQVAGFEYCRQLLSDWAAETGPGTAPPLVLHLCAGASSDGSPQKVVGAIQGMGALVYHAHLGVAAGVTPTLYPSNRAYLPVGSVRDTFDRTSPLSPPLVAVLKEAKLVIPPAARGLIYNAKLADLIRFLGLVKTHVKGWPAESAPLPEPVVLPAPAAPSAAAPAPIEPPPAGAFTPLAAEPVVAVETYPLLDFDQPGASAPADPARLLVLVFDRSVADPFGGDVKNAYARLQERGNEILTKLARKPDPDLQVAVAAYGLDAVGQPEVRTGFEGPLTGQPIVNAAELDGGELRREAVEEQVPNGIGGLLTLKRDKLTFLDLEPAGACSPVPAFHEVKTLLEIWRHEHPAPAKPPVVLHLTRAAQAPGELREAVGQIGGAAVYHLVATEQPHPSLAYPATAGDLVGAALEEVWEVSSPLADAEAFLSNPAIKPGSRGVVVNGKFDCLLPVKTGA
jgi:hypothetical protein